MDRIILWEVIILGHDKDKKDKKFDQVVENKDINKVCLVDLTSRTPPYDRALCEALHDYGHNVELWAAGCHTSNFDEMDVPRRRGLVDLAVHIPGLSARMVKYVKAVEYIINLAVLALYLWRTRPDVLHVQWLPLLEAFPQLELALLRACRQWGIPVVYTVHDILPLDSEDHHRQTFRRVYQRADRLICHTKTTRRRLIEEFGVTPESICHIPHGPLLKSAADREQDDARAALSLPPGRPIALLFGVMRPYKGVDTLIEAWQHVEQEIPEAFLIIAGGGQEDYVEEVQRAISQAEASTIQGRLRFLPEDELSGLIAAADLLVYPYRRITQSGALLAGMNAGKAIVASRVGGFRETLEDGESGRLVPPEEPDLLAETLIELLREPEECRRLGQGARSVLDERFSWEAIAEQTLRCYRDVSTSG